MSVLQRRLRPVTQLSGVIVGAGVIATAALTGMLVSYFANSQAWLLLAEIVVTMLGAVFLIRWQWGVFAILLYLPVEGMVANLLYPAPAALLLNDGLIGVTYLGFAAALSRRQERWSVPPQFVAAFLILSGVCIVEAFNPQITSPLVALVGFRVLLFYIPLFVLGISLAQQPADLFKRLVWLVLLTSLPACLFGIWEWFRGPSGVSELGPAFARTLWVIGPEATNSLIFRPASTFGFIGQFSGYLLFVTLVAFGALHATRRPSALCLLAVLFGAATVAVILSGGRAIWFQLPVAAVAMYLVRGSPLRFPLAVPVIAVALAIAFVVGQPILDNRLPILASSDYLLIHVNNINPFRPELLSWQGLIGHGTGSALGAVRYVNGGSVPTQFETGWYIPIYMFGVMGLVAYLFLYTVVLRLAWFGLQALASDNRWLGAAIFCYLLVIIPVEGSVNYPPANEFFWLFAGLLAGQAIRERIRAGEALPTTVAANTPARMPSG